MGENRSKLGLAATMFIFGTIGIFVKFIPLDSAFIALDRSVVGMLFLLLVKLITRTGFSFSDAKKNLLPLCLSGAFLGFNWILLFESYRYTSVATATVCYNCGPILFALCSPLFFKEKPSLVRILCAITAMLGVVCVSGVFEEGEIMKDDMLGIFFGLCAALLYAATIVLNRKITAIDPMDKAITQLSASSVVMLVYCLFVTDFSAISFTTATVVLLLIIGIVHTGFAYTLYFKSIKSIKPQSIAVLTYIDPVVAVVLSALILKEELTVFSIIGAVFVIASAVICGLYDNKQKKQAL